MRSIPFLCLCLFVPLGRAQWSAPVPVANVNSTMSDFDPSVTFDGLTMYFTRQAPNFEIYRATRTAPYGTFGAATLVAELSDPGTDAAPCARIDDREIFFYSTRAGGSGGSDTSGAPSGRPRRCHSTRRCP